MKALLITISLVVLACIVFCTPKPVPFNEDLWRKTVENQSTEKLYAPHFADGKYFNPWMPQKQGKFRQLLRWKLSKKNHYTDKEKNHKPKIISGLRERINALSDKTDFISWIGHGTFLMRLQDEYWLTDPMFSDRALLPKRITPPALTGEALKKITDTVNDYVSSHHNGPVTELDWWQSIDLPGGNKLVCLPAQHWSKRIGQSVNSTLWASFLIITSDTNVYYGGDSGYFIGYREIGRRFPDITYALIPVTAYHPRWFMHYAHLNADEAIEAFRDLGAEYFIPTQWGAFHLGDNPPGYPLLDLKKAMQEQNVDPSRFILMDIGQITQTE
jgi:L-ascorbate metabolism protein UlaG (beta-lactamase superfamily)